MAQEDGFVDEQLGSKFAVVVVWDKPDRLVNVLSIRVNGRRLALDEMDDESPWVSAKLSAPGSEGFEVEWAIVPKVEVTGLAIAIVNLATGARVKVDSKSPVKRNEHWENNEGKTVNAP